VPPTGGRAWQWVPAIVAVTGVGVATIAALFVFLPQTVRIEGQSMSPTLRNDDRAIVVRRIGEIARGDVVMLRYPRNPAKSFVMRVVGLPGETLSIAGGVVRIDGRPIDEPYVVDANRSREDFGPIRLGADEYFVMGDRRNNASDSREWGPVPRRLIRGRMAWVWYRA
jgi:signal peptidase I